MGNTDDSIYLFPEYAIVRGCCGSEWDRGDGKCCKTNVCGSELERYVRDITARIDRIIVFVITSMNLGYLVH